MTLRDKDQNAVARKPGAGEPLEPRAHPFRQGWRLPDVEAELDRGRELIDILPARTRRANEAFLDFAFADADMSVDPDHVAATVTPILRARSGG